MPQPALTEAQAKDTIQRVEAALRAGGRPLNQPGPGRSAIKMAGEGAVADRVVNSCSTFENRVRTAKERYNLAPDWSLYRPLVYQHASPLQPIPPSQDHTIEPAPDDDPIRVAVIGDAHDSPHLPNKERFYWLGRYIADNQIPWVVSIGDWMTLDSMSTHTDPATFEGFAKPSFEQDIESLHASQRAFHDGLGGWKPKKDIVYGNHCFRAIRWANQHREVIGNVIDPHHKIEEAFVQWHWRTTPFGEYRFIGGVGFIHAPLIPGTNGKTYGGKTGGQRAANDAMFDIVRGDDHKFYVASAPKIGPVKSPRVFGCATALPPGYIETYARKNPGDWETGICDLTIWGGRVRSFKFEDMSLLRRAYGTQTAA